MLYLDAIKSQLPLPQMLALGLGLREAKGKQGAILHVTQQRRYCSHPLPRVKQAFKLLTFCCVSGDVKWQTLISLAD
jgi:hypothetical protein